MIGIGILIFLVLVVIAAWIIKIGVQWGISKSIEDIKVAVRQGILSAEKIKEGRKEKAKIDKETEEVKKPPDDPDVCPKCGAKKPRFGGALDEIQCSKCGYKF
ncbi:unnamed protein product [marine sediment metagenome]|uniref:Uncharacterized protein n=1 Tax=marine sediment metagenome TaxID=412755 RepID=X1U814_9ZZZZ